MTATSSLIPQHQHRDALERAVVQRVGISKPPRLTSKSALLAQPEFKAEREELAKLEKAFADTWGELVRLEELEQQDAPVTSAEWSDAEVAFRSARKELADAAARLDDAPDAKAGVLTQRVAKEMDRQATTIFRSLDKLAEAAAAYADGEHVLRVLQLVLDRSPKNPAPAGIDAPICADEIRALREALEAHLEEHLR